MTFLAAFDRTMAQEGGYVNNATDRGGETYRGIARRFNASWNGWMLIDVAKKETDFPQNLTRNPRASALDVDVKSFYKQQYWDKWQGDGVAELSKRVAAEIFDSAVNCGVQRAISWLQTGLNVLNRNATLYPDMVVDGSLGPTTLKALETYLRTDPDSLLLKIMNVLQGAHYIAFMTKSPDQEAFARGWFNRVEITT